MRHIIKMIVTISAALFCLMIIMIIIKSRLFARRRASYRSGIKPLKTKEIERATINSVVHQKLLKFDGDHLVSCQFRTQGTMEEKKYDLTRSGQDLDRL